MDSVDHTAAPFDFDELSDMLLDQGQATSPAAIHGCLTGLLTAATDSSAEAGLDMVTRVLDVQLHGELAGHVLRLHEVSADALLDDSLAFYPLLPDDDTDIGERTEALADWCHAFLAGFTGAGAVSGANLGEEGAEVLRDIAAMAQAEVGDEESEDELERSFVELVEYLRLAVVNIALARIEIDSGPGSDSLH
ncbi:MAG: UPF0149 family protein [Pseudomonadota bacterium]